jgi:hypothetical protein
MKKSVICLFLLFSITLQAQNRQLVGGAYNALTKVSMAGVKVTLMRSDSSVIDTTRTELGTVNGMPNSSVFVMPVKSGNYLLKFSYPGYETQIIKLKVENSRKPLEIVDFIYLKPQRKVRMLNGAVVKATRIKMVYKGDTIVYDADAFNLAKGSMLDALIAELPGAQLKDDGRILVNGEPIEELLLNGKDFFKGDRNVLLENLPSYMVKNIKVYKKNDPLKDLTKRKPLVMDVLLKKEYSRGWIANAEMSGGTKERYLSRLFGLHYSDRSRLSVYGNMNNINDVRKPGRTGDWQPNDLLSGLQTTHKGGFDYLYENPLSTWQINTSNEVQHTKSNNQMWINNTLFLPTENAYSMNLWSPHNENTRWSTQNKIVKSFGKMNAYVPVGLMSELIANLSYETYTSENSNKLAELSVPLDSLTMKNPLEYLLQATKESQWYSKLLNRSNYISQEHGYQLNTDGKFTFNYYSKANYLDVYQFDAGWNYEKDNTTIFNQRLVEYPNSTSTSDDYRHVYNTTPIEKYNLNSSFTYGYHTSFNMDIYGKAMYQHHYSSTDRSLFNLQKLADWGLPAHRELTELPSTYDSLQLARDGANSYYSHINENEEVFMIGVRGEELSLHDGSSLNMNIYFPLSLKHTRLQYTRAAIDTVLTRNTDFLNPNVYLSLKTKKMTTYTLYYAQATTAPSLVYRLDFKDDTDPLNIMLNNANLKNTTNHQLSLTFKKEKTKHQIMFSTDLNGFLTQHALAMGFVYDTKTGIRTTRPDNVNGNWNIGGGTNYTRCLDAKDLLSFESHTGYQYVHSVDLTGTTDGSGVERSVVHNVNLNEELGLNYKIGQNKVGLKGKVAWSDITSGRANFQNMNVWDFQYGVTGLWNLPMKLQLSTDLTMFSRRGYELNSMNTNDLVWNARLSRMFLNGNLTCFVDGFDILGNLSNIYRSVNAQGRTETRYNVVPRYVMLHVIYRLNVQPKKKK